MTTPAPIIKASHSDGRITYDLGRVGDGKPQQADVGPYSDGPFSTTSHGIYQRATYRPTPLTVKSKPAEIVAQHLAFSYGDTGLKINPLGTHPAFTGSMDNASLIKYMPTTGGGSDRALVTDYTGYFMRTEDPQYMFAQALAGDSIPIHYIDLATGKPVDLLAHPLANTYGSPGQTPAYQPFWPAGPANAAGTAYNASGGWTPTMDHFPACWYVAFLASHDVGFLLNGQCIATFGLVSHPYVSGTTLIGGVHVALIGDGQTRDRAWCQRSLFEAYFGTRRAEELGLDMTGLHPSSYWKKIIDNQLVYLTPRMSDPTRETFRLVSSDLQDAPWQDDYLMSGLALAVLGGLKEWVPLFLWGLGNAIRRTNGTSGWPPSHCGAYKMYTVPGGTDPKLPRFTWAQAFDNQMVHPEVNMTKAQHDAILADPLALHSGTDGTSLNGCRSVLLQADHLDKLGLAGVRAMYPEFDICLTNVKKLAKDLSLVAPFFGTDERWSILPVVSTTPPPGEIHMGQPFTVQVGNSVDLPITWEASGQPSQMPNGIAITAAPTGLVSLVLAPDDSKVTVTGIKAGSPLITVTGTVPGTSTVLSDASQGTVTPLPLPLPTAVHINP